MLNNSMRWIKLKNKKVMLYLDEQEYKRLAESAKQAGKSMNKFVTGLIWGYDAQKRTADEVIEYRCNRCEKTLWVESWVATPPDKCPFSGCSGHMDARGRWGTVVLGRLEPAK